MRNFEKSKTFYERVLAPLGYKLLIDKSPKSAGFGAEDADGKRNFWIKEYDGLPDVSTFSCLAFTANNKEEVENFYKAAIKAGAKDNGAPGYRENYYPAYYAAYVLDPDGYNIEAKYTDTPVS